MSEKSKIDVTEIRELMSGVKPSTPPVSVENQEVSVVVELINVDPPKIVEEQPAVPVVDLIKIAQEVVQPAPAFIPPPVEAVEIEIEDDGSALGQEVEVGTETVSISSYKVGDKVRVAHFPQGSMSRRDTLNGKIGTVKKVLKMPTGGSICDVEFDGETRTPPYKNAQGKLVYRVYKSTFITTFDEDFLEHA